MTTHLLQAVPATPAAHAVPAGFRPDLARWRQLVGPAWLAGLIDGRAVPAAPEGDWCVVEVGLDGAGLFAAGHIPGAACLDTRALECEPLWNKVPDEALLALLLSLGIRHDTAVLLYDRNGLTAARAALMLLFAGVADVRLLDGGFAGWRAAGLPLGLGAPPPAQPAASFGVPFPARPDYLIDTAQARALPARPDAALVSIRTWAEFTGQTSGYDFIAVKGDIPGARWGRAGEGRDVHSMSHFLLPDGRLRPAREVRDFWRAAGIDEGREVVFYCGTGWRASLAFFYAWLMGWPRISVYDGGWFAWSADPANPVVCRADAAAQQSR